MLDARLLRTDPEMLRAALARRDADGLLDEAIALDERRRAVQTRVDELRARRNTASEQIGAAMKRVKEDPAAAAIAERARAEVRDLKTELEGLEADLADVGSQFEAAMLRIPNLPHPSAPLGAREEDAEVVKVVGAPPAFSFEPRDHLAIAGPLIDMERAARTSGSRFGYLLGDIAVLWMAISRFAIDTLRGKGFTPVNPPVLVRREALVGTGFLPGDEAQIYRVPEDELFLVGTSEVSLAALHMGEILPEADLPLRYCGISTCYRREAGAAGRDTRGIFRTHQFEKVEMFSFCHPDRSWQEHEWLLSIEEEIAQALGFHYRVVNIAAGDLGASAAKKYDIEVWLPGQSRYRELTSCSNTTDYQARRLDCRMRTETGPLQVLHTLNGTAVTSSRTLIGVLETHQQADGSVAVPEVLQAYGLPAVLGPYSS
jgi:seryl-tRNA synthetase